MQCRRSNSLHRWKVIACSNAVQSFRGVFTRLCLLLRRVLEGANIFEEGITSQTKNRYSLDLVRESAWIVVKKQHDDSTIALIDWLIGCLTVCQPRKVNVCHVRGEGNWLSRLRMANEIQMPQHKIVNNFQLFSREWFQGNSMCIDSRQSTQLCLSHGVKHSSPFCWPAGEHNVYKAKTTNGNVSEGEQIQRRTVHGEIAWPIYVYYILYTAWTFESMGQLNCVCLFVCC